MLILATSGKGPLFLYLCSVVTFMAFIVCLWFAFTARSSNTSSTIQVGGITNHLKLILFYSNNVV